MGVKTRDVRGAVTEHWMDKRLRLRQPINDPSNVIRINARALMLMNEYRNRLLGTNYSLHEAAEIAKEKNGTNIS